MSIIGYIIDAEGGFTATRIVPGHPAQRMESIRRAIGGTLKAGRVALPEGMALWYDAHQARQDPENTEASRIARRGGYAGQIYGDALVTGAEQDGAPASLTLDQQASIVIWWRAVTIGGANLHTLRSRLALVA